MPPLHWRIKRMYRGTTPTLTFNLPFAASTLSAAYITFAQFGASVFEKALTDCTASGQALTVTLTQSDTLLLNATEKVEIQIRGKTTDGEVIASNIMRVPVDRILKDGEI